MSSRSTHVVTADGRAWASSQSIFEILAQDSKRRRVRFVVTDEMSRGVCVEVFEAAKLERYMGNLVVPLRAHREFDHPDQAIMWCVMQCAIKGEG